MTESFYFLATTISCVLLLASATTVQAQTPPATATELLVETEWLDRNRADSNVCIIDVRDPAEYAKSHIPGAVNLPASGLRDPSDKVTYLPSVGAFTDRLNTLGITPSTHVIACDNDIQNAARLWYVLTVYGHMSVSVLNGGIPKWESEKRLLTADATRRPSSSSRSTWKASPVRALSCSGSEVMARNPETLILDTRSAEEFRGEKRSGGGTSQSGRIPGAINIDWRENLIRLPPSSSEGAPIYVFKGLETLRSMYTEAGVVPGKRVVLHCATGGRASVSLLALQMLHIESARLYYGSFADYSNLPGASVVR